jgi:hypothetical protein
MTPLSMSTGVLVTQHPTRSPGAWPQSAKRGRPSTDPPEGPMWCGRDRPHVVLTASSMTDLAKRERRWLCPQCGRPDCGGLLSP